MPSGRRPPPPPPKDNLDPPPPPLPSRNGSTGNRQQMEPTRSLPSQTAKLKTFHVAPPKQDDDTYEQPTPQSSSDISPATRGGINSSSIQSISVAENSDSEGWSESEWEDPANLDLPSTAQSDHLCFTTTKTVEHAGKSKLKVQAANTDHTYLMPDGGGMVQDDEYNLPDDSQESTKENSKLPNNSRILQVTETDLSSVQLAVSKSKLLAKSTANCAKDEKRNMVETKSSETGNPKIPIKKTVLVDKPVPKPKTFKLAEPVLPSLPPRPKEKPLPTIPSVLGSKTDISLDNPGAGSVSSDLVSCPADLEVQNLPDLHKKSRVLVLPAVHEEIQKKRVTEKGDTGRGQEVKTHPNGIDAPIYDDGVSEVLSRFDWFHGELEREEGAKRVTQLSGNGTFLIRASNTDGTNNSHPYTLVVTLDKKVYNLMIRLRQDHRYAIGTHKPEEVSFQTVPELVEHHKEHNIKLTGGGAVKLTHTPKK